MGMGQSVKALWEIQDTGCWIPDAGYCILDAGYLIRRAQDPRLTANGVRNDECRIKEFYHFKAHKIKTTERSDFLNYSIINIQYSFL
jgi:hypothetical protein